MTKQFLYSLLFLCTLCPHLPAQTRTWQTSVPFTYVYQLTEEQARELMFEYNGNERVANTLMSGDKPTYTSFRDTWENPPATGHFLLINIVGGRMEYNYRSFAPYEVTVLPTIDCITLQVIDKNGTVRPDAIVKVSRQWSKQTELLPYDSQTKTYSTKKLYSGPLFLTVELEGNHTFLEAEKVKRQQPIPDEITGIRLEGEIKDGFFQVALHNPEDVETIWYIYDGWMLKEKGSGKQMNVRTSVTKYLPTCYVDVFYRKGSEVQTLTQKFSTLPHDLNISTNLPETIRPEEEIEVTVTVRHPDGKPVKYAYVTAFSVNKNDTVIPLSYPYTGSDSSLDRSEVYQVKPRQWDYSMYHFEMWNRVASLHSRPFYQFLYPSEKEWFIHTEPAPDSITQFAPFIARYGRLDEIKIIECDGKPIWFSWVDNIQNYSFPIEPDKEHTIRLRTAEYSFEIKTDSGFFKPGMKTLFSINTKSFQLNNEGINYSWKIRTEPKSLKSKEANEYRKYVSKIPVEPHAPYTFLKQGKKEIPVRINNRKSVRSYQMIGPVEEGSTSYNDSISYQHEGGFRYEYKGDIVYKYYERELVPLTFGQHYHSYPFDIIHEYYLTPGDIEEMKKAPAPTEEPSIEQIPVSPETSGSGNKIWQKHVYANRKGEATFKIKVPHDFTGWDIFIYGMIPHKKIGVHQTTVSIDN